MDRLLTEEIDLHARAFTWPLGADGKPKWRVSHVHEIIGANVGSLRAAIGNAAGSNISLAVIAAPAIIVIDSLTIAARATTIISAPIFFDFYKDVKFYRHIDGRADASNLADVLSQPTNFEISNLFSDGTHFYYRYKLSSPLVFSVTNVSKIGLYAPNYGGTNYEAIHAAGKALIISNY